RANREFAGTLCRQIESGVLPLRVTHNDTKTNNILFDRDTLDPLVIIDLDTCMPGLACYDFGDTIRFAACTAEEDRPDGMSLDLNLFRAYTEGYLSEMKDVLSPAEMDSLATGAAVITLELASRFLADYLIGDKYFRIDYPEQNLRRAQAQLTLFRDMMLHMDDMRRIIAEVTAR
ncbi:MAG: phosphotransferase, partial [Candidatus Limivicinus sp.]